MKKPRVGQWVRVRFSDVGVREGIYLGDGMILEPFDTDSTSINGAPIIELGQMLEVGSAFDKVPK